MSTEESARRIWDNAGQMGPVIGAYFTWRGLAVPETENLRFVPSLKRQALNSALKCRTGSVSYRRSRRERAMRCYLDGRAIEPMSAGHCAGTIAAKAALSLPNSARTNEGKLDPASGATYDA